MKDPERGPSSYLFNNAFFNRAVRGLFHCHCHVPVRHSVTVSAERYFVSADSTYLILASFRIHYFLFVHSIAFAARTAAVVSSAALFDSHSVSYHFVSGQNSFAPAVASFHSDGVRTHC